MRCRYRLARAPGIKIGSLMPALTAAAMSSAGEIDFAHGAAPGAIVRRLFRNRPCRCLHVKCIILGRYRWNDAAVFDDTLHEEAHTSA